jgi:hypothetical protein
MKISKNACRVGLALWVALFVPLSCETQAQTLSTGSLEAHVGAGEDWLHQYSAFQKNPPQFALWVETEGGEYVKTLYATRKVATQGWAFANGNRRKESLPYWAHRRGVVYPDGLYLPTKAEPLTDAVSGATPHAGLNLRFDAPEGQSRFYLYLEINQSTDFNAAYSKDAAVGSAAYSGGAEGSGQPALVYRVLVDLATENPGGTYELVGHASPDGADGSLNSDVNGIDSALKILGGLNVTR